MQGLPGYLSGKEPTCKAGDPGSIPGSGRSPRVGRRKANAGRQSVSVCAVAGWEVRLGR